MADESNSAIAHLQSFYNAAVALENRWDEDTLGLGLYPFSESFEEIRYKIGEWLSAVGERAKTEVSTPKPVIRCTQTLFTHGGRVVEQCREDAELVCARCGAASCEGHQSACPIYEGVGLKQENVCEDCITPEEWGTIL